MVELQSVRLEYSDNADLIMGNMKLLNEKTQQFQQQLLKLYDTVGFGKIQMLEYNAEQLLSIGIHGKLIQAIDDKTKRLKQEAIAQKELEKAVKDQIAVDERAISSQISLNAQRARMLNEQKKLEEDSIASLNRQRQAALAAQSKMELDSQAALNRQRQDAFSMNRKEAMRILEEQERAAVALAEKQAIEEIKWGELSLKARIAQLEKLKAYQAGGSVSAKTIESTFGSAALKDLPNLSRLQSEFADNLLRTKSAHEGAASATKKHGIELLGMNVSARAVNESLVVTRELASGNTSKLGGSISILAQALNLTSVAAIGTAAAVLAPIAAIGALTLAFYKGKKEQEDFTNSLILTGNYAGTTSDGLYALSKSAAHAGGSLGEAKKAVIELASTGKFTSDQIGTIATAAVNMEHATGKSIDSTISDFEKLAVQTNGSTKNATDAVSKAVLELDDKYHFLTLAVYEQISALEKEGSQKEASKIATDELARVTNDRAESIIQNLGNVEAAWNKVKRGVLDTIDASLQWGKTATAASEVARLTTEKKKIEGFGTVKNGELPEGDSYSGKYRQVKIELLKAQEALNLSNKDANIQASVTLRNNDAIHAKSEIDAEDKRIQKRGLSELTIALQKYEEQRKKIALVNPLDKELDPSFVKARIAALTKEHTAKVDVASGRMAPIENKIIDDNAYIAGIQARIKAIQEQGAVEETVNKHINQAKAESFIADGKYNEARKGWSVQRHEEANMELLMNALRKDDVEAQLAAAIAISKAQTTATTNLNALNGELEDNKQGIQRVSSAHEDAAKALIKYNGIAKDDAANQRLITTAKLEDLKTLQVAKEKLLLGDAKKNTVEADKNVYSADKMLQYGAATRISTLEVVKLQIAEQKLTGKISEEVEQQALLAASRKDASAAYLEAAGVMAAETDRLAAIKMAANVGAIGDEQASVVAAGMASEQRISIMEKEADVWIENERLKNRGSANPADEAQYAKMKKTISDLRTITEKKFKVDFDIAGLKDTSKVFSDLSSTIGSFGQSFDNFSKGLGGVASSFKKLADIQTKEETDHKKYTADKIGAYGDMADAAKHFFKEGSTGYQTMDNVAKAFHAAQMAMQIAEMGMLAVRAIMRAAGDGGWVGMLAMAAAMAALGYAFAGGGGGGDTSAQKQKTQGTGTVFGDSSAKDDSFAKSMDIVAKNSNVNLTYTRSMEFSLRSIANNIGGLTNMLINDKVGSGSMASGTLGFTQGGTAMSKFANQFSLLGGGAKLWGGTTTTLTDSGIKFDKQSLKDILGPIGLKGSEYANTNTETKGLQKLANKLNPFGGGGDDGPQTFTKDLDPKYNSQFTKIFQGISDTVLGATGALGILPAEVQAKMDTFVLEMTDISLKDLKGSEQQAAIEAVFGKIGSDIAEWVMPGIEKLSKVGETSLTTLVRVAVNYETATNAIKLLGNTSVNAFGKVGLVAGTNATKLIEMAGGIEKFTSNVQAYFKNAFTDTEQQTMGVSQATSTLNTTFGELGITIPTSWKEMNKLLNSFDLTTEKGKKAWTAVMGVSDSFATLHGTAQQAKDSIMGFKNAMAAARGEDTSNPQGATDSAMANLTAAAPWIKSTTQLLTMSKEDFANYDITTQGLITTTLLAIGTQKRYDQALAESTKKSIDGYDHVMMKHNGMTDAQITAADHTAHGVKLQTDANIDLSRVTDKAYLQTLKLTPAQWDLVASYIAEEDSAKNAAKATRDAAAALNGIDWGTLANGAQSAFDLLMSGIVDSAKTLSDGDFSKELGITIQYLNTQMGNLEAKRQSLIGVGNSGAAAGIGQEMYLAQQKIADLTKDLTQYTILEAQYKGHGRELVDLQHWHDQQAILMQGNGSALLRLEEATAKKRLDIINGGLANGLNKTSDTIRKWLESIKLNSTLSPLTDAQKLKEANGIYLQDLMKANGGDADALGRITKDAEDLLSAQKAVSGFGGEYSALFAKVQLQISQLVNGNIGNSKGATTADIEALKLELADVKVELARLLAMGNNATQAQTAALVAAITVMSARITQATTTASTINNKN